jgi:hypothetical protein
VFDLSNVGYEFKKFPLDVQVYIKLDGFVQLTRHSRSNSWSKLINVWILFCSVTIGGSKIIILSLKYHINK